MVKKPCKKCGNKAKAAKLAAEATARRNHATATANSQSNIKSTSSVSAYNSELARLRNERYGK